MTYTEGPWSIEFASARMKNNAGAFSIDADGLVICARAGWPDRAEESKANARLIAAAPDLLEAAKDAVREWRLHGQLTDSCRVLEAAIAKADGAK